MKSIISIRYIKYEMTTKMLGWWSGRMVYILLNTEIITIKLKQFQKNILQNEIRIHICSQPAGNVNVSRILDYYLTSQDQQTKTNRGPESLVLDGIGQIIFGQTLSV